MAPALCIGGSIKLKLSQKKKEKKNVLTAVDVNGIIRVS
jgi:hypothetical protein